MLNALEVFTTVVVGVMEWSIRTARTAQAGRSRIRPNLAVTTSQHRDPPRSQPPVRTEAEQKKLSRTAHKADLPLSTYVRKTALERALATLNERMAALKKRDGEEG